MTTSNLIAQKKKKRSRKMGNVTGNVVAHKQKKKNATLLPWKREERKKCNLK